MPTLSRTPVDWQAYEAFCTEFKAKHSTVQGADAAYALSIGREPNAFSHLKRRHYRNQPQATAGGVPSRTESTPTTKHSFVVAVDTLEAIQQFAAAHHLHVNDALELLVRTGLEAHREGGRAISGHAGGGAVGSGAGVVRRVPSQILRNDRERPAGLGIMRPGHRTVQPQ